MISFNEFNSINEELEMSTDLYSILELLKAKGDKVAIFLMKLRMSKTLSSAFDTDYIDLGSNLSELSFIAKNRVNTDPTKWLDNFEDSRRQSIKTGRLVKRLINDLPKDKLDFDLNTNFTDSDIEKFVNEFLAIRKELNLDELGIEFKIVEGYDIAKYYHYPNYFGYTNGIRKGTLWNSCMRFDRCQRYFSIYTENTDQIKMLTLLTKDGRAIGRALLWVLDDIPFDDPFKKHLADGMFLDRIYSINDSDEKLFINYAIKNGWYYKDNTKSICLNNKQLPNAILKVTLDNEPSGEYFPYMDTLSYFTNTKDALMLSNITEYNYTLNLNSTSGAWQGADDDYEDLEVEDDD